MSELDAQAIRDAHVALLELERAGLASPHTQSLEARIAALERQFAALQRALPAARALTVIVGGKRERG